jgi:hypothetical protein
MWCDEVIVYLHCCTDGSERIVEDVRRQNVGRVHIVHQHSPVWAEMIHRQTMLEIARQCGATHVAIIDADEVLTANVLPLPSPRGDWTARDGDQTLIRFHVQHMLKDSILQLPLYNLRGSLNGYHSSGVWGCNRFLSVAFADDPRLCWSGDTFHRREPSGAPLSWYQPIKHGQGGVMHLWGCSERRLRARHALYKVTERLRWPAKPLREIEQEYNLWRSPEDAGVKWPAQTDWQQPWTFADVPASWWEPYAHLMQYLDVDAEPWQEAEVRRLVTEHGAALFTGLDLFGVV